MSEPRTDRIPYPIKTIGVVLVAFLAAMAPGVAPVTITSTLCSTNSAAKRRQAIDVAIREACFEEEILAFYIA
jgi:hypothetical protein